MGRLDGKVAVISGAARGQGRAHAVRLAAEGADIVAFDICDGFVYNRAPAATSEELEQTRDEVEALGRRCLIEKVDARDLAGLQGFAGRAYSEFGRVDIIVVNHGIWTVDRNSWELSEESWQESIDVLLTGAWKVQKAFVPKMIEGGRGGSVVFTSSVNAIVPQPGAVAYCAAKSGMQMLMKVLAHELGPHEIRVNTVNPGSVDTAIRDGGNIEKSIEYYPYVFGDGPRTVLGGTTARPPSIISDAVAWLVSDEARFVTGAMIPVDAGRLIW
ncbi:MULTISPECIES: mycofactocin-coupled SDR family oxidoreductase [unclassified Pseudonocardia]|uniref:mycofactocin-coupled SDR family oxidoreductase n=1 Tax=unclassified Pseudonocardia TaxID=2619320 RepID=UPI0001FFE695|nr:mycofactocin-coupled SDR family oxidoreductase [Pseudonocardia sp. Ae707_Ps1]OLM08960.1 3-oxoacyl-[acyl-carrier protein] reductase [Pseudonocardia sp. Ae707_Ps1]